MYQMFAHYPGDPVAYTWNLWEFKSRRAAEEWLTKYVNQVHATWTRTETGYEITFNDAENADLNYSMTLREEMASTAA